jgi:hypothetical protein
VKAKQVVTLAGVAFVLFYVITRPGEAADAVHDILSWLRDGAEAVILFLRNVTA